MSDQSRGDLGDIPWPIVKTEYTQVRDTSFTKKTNPYSFDLGTRRKNGVSAFPEGYFDFNNVGDGDAEAAFSSAENYQLKEHTLVTFKHSAYDNNSNGKKYNVMITLVRMSGAHAQGSRLAPESRERQHKEWYIDHDGGYKDANGNVQHVESYQYPSRENPGKTTDSQSYLEVNYTYETLECLPGHCVGILTRSAEKDANSADALDIANQVRNWIDSFSQFTSKPSLPTEWDVVYAVIDRLVNWLVAGAQDDVMCPMATAISQGAARYIYENYPDHTFEFSRKVYGQSCGLEDVSDYPSPPGDPIQPYFFKLNTHTNRTLTLEYKIQVFDPEELASDPAYCIYLEENGQKLYWGLDQGVVILLTDENKRELFTFKNAENGMQQIFHQRTGKVLVFNISNIYGNNTYYDFFLVNPTTDNLQLGKAFTLSEQPGGGYKIFLWEKYELYNREGILSANQKNEYITNSTFHYVRS